MTYQLAQLQTQNFVFMCLFDRKAPLETIRWRFQQAVKRHCKQYNIESDALEGAIETDLDIFLVTEGTMYRDKQKFQR